MLTLLGHSTIKETPVKPLRLTVVDNTSKDLSSYSETSSSNKRQDC